MIIIIINFFYKLSFIKEIYKRKFKIYYIKKILKNKIFLKIKIYVLLYIFK